MNREIKFRIWNNHAEEMDYKDFYVNGNKIIYDDGHSYEDVEIHSDIIVMQFTGLKDKNGKEIYEGDVLKNFGIFKRLCLFKEGSFGYEADANLGFISYNSNSINLKLRDGKLMKCEIVGNIYENPELSK